MHKKKRYILILISLLLISSIVLWLLYPRQVQAVWFDDAYDYRHKITFTHDTDISADRAVTLTLDTAELIAAGLMQSDCDDTRFTNTNGKVLDYELTGSCDNASTTYEVVFPAVVNGTNLFFVYYGNPIAVSKSISTSSVTAFTPSGGDPSLTNPTSSGNQEKGTTPILHWRFSEGYSTTANDQTANNNDGTSSGATWQNEDLCVFDKCFLFDGTTDLVSKTYSSDTELDFGTGSFSVSLWFRHPTTSSATQYLVSRFNADGFKIYMASGGTVCFGIDDDGTWSPADSACSTTTYNDNKWHFLEAVKSTTASITTYVDGKQVGTDASLAASTSLSGTTPTFYVGVDSDGTSSSWSGFIDDVKVWNYAKSTAQILADFNARGLSEGVSVSFGADDADERLDVGLVGYWKFDETSSNAADSSSNGSTLTNFSTSPYVPGKFGNATDLELSSTDYFFAADSATLSLTGSLTLSAWIRPEDVTTITANIVNKWDGANESYNLIQINDEIRLYIDSASNYVTTNAANLAISTFYHVVGTYDATTATAKIFINGYEYATTTTGTIPTSIGDDGGRFHVGVEDSTGVDANFYDGYIDDVRLYNRALLPREVNALFKWEPAPIWYWRLDEKTGTTANDVSGSGNTGTLTNTPTWIQGQFGGAIHQASPSSEMIATTTDLNTWLGRSGSLMAWIRTTQTGVDTRWQAPGLAGVESSGNANDIFYGYITANGSIGMASGDATAATAGPINDGDWHHVGLTRSSTTGENVVYIDGVRMASSTGDTGVKTTSFSAIGRILSSSNPYFDGDYDDVRIYNYVRSPEGVIADMNGGHPAVGTPFGSEAGHWNFDASYGTTAQDSTPNGLDLTLNSASWSDGKFGNAWNGTNATWLTRGGTDDPEFDFIAGENFTITMWFRSDSANNPGATEYLLSKDCSPGYCIFAQTDGDIVVGIDDDTTLTPDDTAGNVTRDFYDATWHHLAAVYTSVVPRRLEMYIDGKLTETDTSIAATATLANSVQLIVGDLDATDNGDEFAGDIDELRIYRYALNQEQVLVDMNQAKSAVLGALSTTSDGVTASYSYPRTYCVPGDTSTCNEPLGEWKMDERTGTTANDHSNNNNTGTLAGGPTWGRGKIGAAVDFDGDDSYVSTTLGITETSAYSVAFWVYPRTLTTGDGFFVTTQAGQQRLYYSTSGGNHIRFCNDTSCATEATSTNDVLTTEAWNHVVVSYSGSSTALLYVNGINVTSSNNTSETSSAGSFSFGNVDDGSPANGIDGLMDEVIVFDYALTYAQVAWVYNRGGPIAHYKLDECQGTTAYNSAVNANGDAVGLNGTISAGSTGGTNSSVGSCGSGTSTEMWNNGTTGKLNYSLDFDGDTSPTTDADYVEVSDNSLLDLANDDDFTFEAWVNRDTFNTFDIIAAKSSDITANVDGWQIYIHTTDIIGWEFDATDGSHSGQSTSTITSTGWNHIVLTYDDGGNTSTIYINGKANGTGVGTAASKVNALTMRIGAESDGDNPFDGKIDNVKIYRYAMTAAQVKIAYNDAATVRMGPASGAP